MAVRGIYQAPIRRYALRLEERGTEVQILLIDLKSNSVLASEIGQVSDLETLNQLRDGSRFRLEAASDAELRRLGIELGQFVFPGALKSEIYSAAAREPISIGIEAIDEPWSNHPWEFLRVEGIFDGPLVLHPNIRIHRMVRPSSSGGESKEGARKVLVVCANPQSARFPHLAGIESELLGVIQALQSPECSHLEYEVLRYATPSALNRCLSNQPTSVLHFVGHGISRPSGGALVLESDKPNEESLMYADELAPLALRAGVQLVLLSSCLTAGSSGSVGASLAEAGLASVIGMQLPVKDSSCHLFSRAFYASLAASTPLDLAVFHGRSALAGTGLDWGAPVLFTNKPGESVLTPKNVGITPQKRHNLPQEDRPFVGREVEKADLKKLIVDRGARLITVTGMGGMGKTRLAREVALGLVEHFDDGVWLIECEALAHGEEMIAVLSAALGLETNAMSEAAVLDALESKRLLLVFDCMERLVGEAAIIPKIIRSAPGVQILVTSRVLLDFPSEREFTLDTMSVNRKKQRKSEGVQLFTDAASFADPSFALSRKNQKLVETLVLDLEAVPLAIVLAAGRLRHMSLEQLSERVRSQRLEVLRRKPVGPNDRHADLLRVVGDSLELLYEEDRTLLKSLSIFRGGFFMHDAEAILGSTPAIVDGIALLRDHSLLRSQIVQSQMRFRILDTVREYLDRIATSEELAKVRMKHAAHFASEAIKIRALFDGGEYLRAREQLWLEIGNFRAAVQHAIQTRDDELVRKFAGALARVYFEAGAREEFEVLAIAAEGVAAVDDQRLLVELHGLHGELCRREDLPEKAKTHWRKRASLCQQLEDVEAEADSYLDIADLALGLKDLDTVEEMLFSFALLEDRLPRGPVLASAVVIKAKTQVYREQIDDALESCEKAETIMRSVTVDRQALFVWIALAQIYRSAGANDDCVRLCCRLLSDALVSGHYLSAGKALLELSLVYEQEERFEQAASAIAIACLIPRTVSATLRDQAIKRRQAFSKGKGAHVLEAATHRCGVGDWQSHAWDHVLRDQALPAK